MRVARAIVALVVIGASAIARPAAAQEPGVVLDPASPAGKEYAFPLDVQRAAAVGKDAVQGVPQPRFGVGITRAAGGASAPGGSRAAAGGSPRSEASGSKAGSTARRSSRRSARGAASGRKRAAKGAPDGAALAELSRPSSTSLEVALATLGVVLGGLVVGGAVALARRRRA
jgi:hypothetical protein